MTHKQGFITGLESLAGSPYDGHTLKGALEQVKRLTGQMPEEVFIDRGYKGHDVTETSVFMSGQRSSSAALKKRIKRRSAIEPVIGHMKMDGKLGRNYLKGTLGNTFNACLSGAGYNFRMILKKIKPSFLEGFFRIFFLKMAPNLRGPLFLS